MEGWSPERIQQTYGYLNELKAYQHKYTEKEWERPGGTTEDGIERQKLIATAIIEKRDRIQAADLLRVWVRDLDPDKMVMKQEAFDCSFLKMARAGVPAGELGKLWLHPNAVSVARASHPIGLINAGDPASAADDTHEVGRLYAGENAPALRWAAAYNAAIAAACRPDATVDSVLQTAREFIPYRADPASIYARYDRIEQEIDRALELASQHSDLEALRDAFATIYHGGDHMVYHMSQANEIVSKGLAVFYMTKGDPKEAILAAVNFGRDTDCLAAIAGGLAGALSGSKRISSEWVDQVNEATAQDPYTNNRRTIDQTADGLYDAYQVRRAKLSEWLDLMAE